MAPGPNLVSSEVFSLGFRAKAMSLSRFCSRSVGAAAVSSFLTLRSELSDAGVMLLFCGFCLTNCLFVYALVPETKGLSLEQMRATFENVRFPCEPLLSKDNGAARHDGGDDGESMAFKNEMKKEKSQNTVEEGVPVLLVAGAGGNEEQAGWGSGVNNGTGGNDEETTKNPLAEEDFGV